MTLPSLTYLRAQLAGELGVTAITPGQFMDFWLLHEIPHSFGNSHPGNNSATTQQAYDKNIWINCFQ